MLKTLKKNNNNFFSKLHKLYCSYVLSPKCQFPQKCSDTKSRFTFVSPMHKTAKMVMADRHQH